MLTLPETGREVLRCLSTVSGRWLQLTGILFCVALVGCDKDETQDATELKMGYVLECAEADKMSAFVLECIKNANPKSDEEPEDWIKLCKYMSDGIHCKEVDAFYYKTGYNRSAYTKCSEAKNDREKTACGLGKKGTEPNTKKEN